MSSGGPSLCRYFASGACSKGSACTFSHDRSAKPDTVCRFYLAGSCTYGSRCRYDHVRPGTQRQSKIPPPPQKNPDDEPPRLPQMTSLAQAARVTDTTAAEKMKAEKLAVAAQSRLRPDAVEFVPSVIPQAHPSTFSYAGAVSGVEPQLVVPVSGLAAAQLKLCPYWASGACGAGEECTFRHDAAPCDLCGLLVMDPYPDAAGLAANRAHRAECLATHEAEMEAAFAEQASADKTCAICMDVVLEKGSKAERRFGILTNCRHCFCLPCIRQWRGQGRAEDDPPNSGWDKRFVRQCPECRVSSEFVVPSPVWVVEEEPKAALITAYRQHLHSIPCKYHQAATASRDNPACAFGNKCFYRHINPDGSLAEGEDPRDIQRRLRASREGGAGPSAVLADFISLRLGSALSRLQDDTHTDWARTLVAGLTLADL